MYIYIYKDYLKKRVDQTRLNLDEAALTTGSSLTGRLCRRRRRRRCLMGVRLRRRRRNSERFCK